jgi:hypothetical protein
MAFADAETVSLSNVLARRVSAESRLPAICYFFEARVAIGRSSLAQFEASHGGAGMTRVVELLEQAGLTLMHSAVHEEDGRVLVYYNFWELGANPGRLAAVERALADKVLWAEFIKLLDRREEKDFIYPLTEVTQGELPLGFNVNSSRYLRIEYDVRPFGNAELRARLEASLKVAGARNGWFLGNTYLQHSGAEGRVLQMWLVPGTLTAEHAERAVRALPWRAALPNGQPLFRDVRHQLLSRSAFDRDPVRAANLERSGESTP